MIKKKIFDSLFHEYIPEDLNEKYFDFIPRVYTDEKFCMDILEQIKRSHTNCNYYKEKICEKFKFEIPDEITVGDLERIPYIPTNIYKMSGNRTLELLKTKLDNILIFSCSSSTTGDPSIVPRTIEDFDQIQYNSIKVFSDFFRWEQLDGNAKNFLAFNFAPNRTLMSMIAKKNCKGFEYYKKTRYFTACMNRPWEFYGNVEYMIKFKALKTIWAILSTFSVKGGFVLDVSKMLRMIKTILNTGYWEKKKIDQLIFGGSPLLMNNMFEKRLLKENIFHDLDGISFVGCGGGGWEGVKGEARLNAVEKSTFISNFEKVFNIKTRDIADIYAFTESPVLFGGHWSEKYNDFLLHCPDTARIIVRDFNKLNSVNEGEEGLLEVITPYGVNGSINQAVLVDDIVELISKEKCPECGYKGATFRILGRLRDAQGKSCSSLINWIY